MIPYQSRGRGRRSVRISYYAQCTDYLAQREAAVRSLSPATDTSPVRHKDKGKESVRYSPYGERSPGPSSPRSRMGRVSYVSELVASELIFLQRVSVRQPSVPLISHSDTPEPDLQANEVVVSFACFLSNETVF